jgi:hypothetical protein
VNVLVWHVHGSWLSAFVAGGHRYLLPVRPGSDRGRKRAEWPDRVVEVTPAEARDADIDVVVYQNAAEVADVRDWIGDRRIPAIYLEHNTPEGAINAMRHPFADRDDLEIVHVTHFNALFWDTGSTRTRVIEHGIPDPGYRYTGELERTAVVINEAQRRGRVTGTDLLPFFARVAPIDHFGIGTPRDLPQRDLHAAIAQRRVYLHPYRWTSLGLSLLEAMLVGMPVVALATTENPNAVTPATGICTNDLGEAAEAIRRLMHDRDAAVRLGRAGRAHVLERYDHATFLRAWNAALDDATSRPPAVRVGR